MAIFEMTIEQALTIQRAQIAYYRRAIGRKGIKAIRARTHIPEHVSTDVPMPVSQINCYVPRGADFERYIKHFINPGGYDPTTMALHDAIRRGIA